MKVVGWIVAVLSLATAGGMAAAASRMLGPDNSDPPRGIGFDIFWVAYHTGPCVLLAVLTVYASRFRSRRFTIGVCLAAIVIIAPGLWVASDESGSPPGGFSPTYGLWTAAAVAVQYVIALFAWAVTVAVGWSKRRKEAGRTG